MLKHRGGCVDALDEDTDPAIDCARVETLRYGVRTRAGSSQRGWARVGVTFFLAMAR